MIGQSKRVRKMIKYHRLAAKIDRRYERLAVEAKTFIAHVKACLPARKERWWRVVFEDIRDEDRALGRLKEDLMLEAKPLDVAFECAQKMENQSQGTLRAKRALDAQIDELKFREEQILRERKTYKDLLVKEDRLQRESTGKWYDAVLKIRGALAGSEIAPLTQVNKLQAALQKEVDLEVGFSELSANSLGKGALRGLAVSNRPPDGNRSSDPLGKEEENQSPDECRPESVVEDVIWALYLSIASGDRVPGGTVKTEGDDWKKVCVGTDIVRN